MSHYHPNTPGQYPAPQYIPPAPKKKIPLWAKLIIGIVGVPMILVGAISAVVGAGTAAETVSTATSPTYDPGINTPEAVPSPKVTHKPAPPAESKITKSQAQAIRSAKEYLDTQAYSRLGLIHQLSSAYGEGFSQADATFAVDHVTVDWDAQAARAAEEYLASQSFSRAGLIHQLESEYGGRFTHAQAVYGVTKAGL